MIELVIFSFLIWLPLAFYAMSRRGFILILAWLFIAPVALYALDTVGDTRLVGLGAREGAKSEGGGYVAAETNVRARELLDPTRILFVGIVLVFLLEAGLKRRRLGALDRTEKFALIFALILIANALFRSNRTAFALRVASDAFIIPFFAYFVARRLVTTEDQLRKLTQVLGYMGVYLIIMGLIERLTLNGLYLRVTGPFADRNEIYIVMVVVFFVVLLDTVGSVPAFNGRRALPRIVRQFVLCFSPVIILLGWGRGNLVGLLSGIWILMFLGRRLVNSSRIIGTIGLVLVLVPTLVIGFYEITPEEVVAERIERPRTIFARFGAWQIILGEVSKSPVTGIGLNNLRDILDEKRILFYGAYSENNPHNSFFTLLAELGLVGFLAYFAIGVSIIRTGLIMQGTRTALRLRWRGVALIAIITAYWVAALFANMLHLNSVSPVYVYFTAGAISGLHIRRRSAVALAGSALSRRTKIPAGAIDESNA